MQISDERAKRLAELILPAVGWLGHLYDLYDKKSDVNVEEEEDSKLPRILVGLIDGLNAEIGATPDGTPILKEGDRMTDGHCQMAREEARKRKEKAEPTEPSLTEAIEWGETVTIGQVVKDGFHLDADEWRPLFCCLVVAAENWQRNAQKAFDCYNARSKAEEWRCPSRDKFDRQLQALRRQLDDIGKEKAGLKYKLTEMEGLVKMHCQGVDDMTEAYDSKEKEVMKLRSQLAETEERLKTERLFKEGFRRTAEGFRELVVKIDKANVNLRTQLAETEREVERLEEELDDLRLSTTPEFIEAMSLISQGLGKGKIDYAEVKKRIIKIPPNPAPTDAEVEKVARLIQEGAYENPLNAVPWKTVACTAQDRYRRQARRIIERGYRREE